MSTEGGILHPQHWRRLRCVFEHRGYRFGRVGFVASSVGGESIVGVHPTRAAPLILPMEESVSGDSIGDMLESARLSGKDYLRILEDC